jgi:hypothetical protein
MPPNTETVFRARLEQTGPQLFRALYRGDINPNEPRNEVAGDGDHILPDSHIGTNPQSVRAFVEALAENRGCTKVVWEV